MSGCLSCIAPLFVPGDRPERFAKAAASGADAIVLDLEDAVAPEMKAQARASLATDFTSLPVFVRINAIGTPWHAEDLAAVERLPIAGIMLPKAEPGSEFNAIETSHPIVALIETARGIADARHLAADRRVGRLSFGSLDYCVDLGSNHTRDALLLARLELVLASRLGNLPAPIDGVTADLEDVALAQDDARYARELGFGGKLCVHPRQVAAVMAGMCPGTEEIAWAKRVLDAAAGGGGAIRVDGKMVDQPVIERARVVMARSRKV